MRRAAAATASSSTPSSSSSTNALSRQAPGAAAAAVAGQGPGPEAEGPPPLPRLLPPMEGAQSQAEAEEGAAIAEPEADEPGMEAAVSATEAEAEPSAPPYGCTPSHIIVEKEGCCKGITIYRGGP